MANETTSGLTSGGVVEGADKIYIIDSGNSRRNTIDDVKTYIKTAAIDILPDTVVVEVFAADEDIVVGDGAAIVPIPKIVSAEGRELIDVEAWVITPATGSGTETIDIQIARVRAGVAADVLTTKLTVNEDDYHSKDATAAAIDATKDDVAEGDTYRIDIDAVPSTTPGTGLWVAFQWKKP